MHNPAVVKPFHFRLGFVERIDGCSYIEDVIFAFAAQKGQELSIFQKDVFQHICSFQTEYRSARSEAREITWREIPVEFTIP